MAFATGALRALRALRATFLAFAGFFAFFAVLRTVLRTIFFADFFAAFLAGAFFIFLAILNFLLNSVGLGLGWELFDSPRIFLNEFGFQVVSACQAQNFLHAA